MRKRLRHLPVSLAATAVLMALAVPVGWLSGGLQPVLGAVAGLALVAVNYLVSSLVVVWVDLVAREMLLPVVMLTYVLKFVTFGVALYAANRVQWSGLFAFGVAVIVGTFVWGGTQLYWILGADKRVVRADSGLSG